MSKRLRTILFIAFAAIFITTAPAVVLMTAGFRYNWEKHRLEKTGVLQLDSEPRGARILLNGTPLKETTPASIFHVLPEDYRIRMEKQGYFPWEKTLEVPSGGTVFARNVVLYDDSLPQLAYGATFESSAWDSGARVVALVVRDKDGSRHAELYYADGDGSVRRLPWMIPPGATVAMSFNSNASAVLFDVAAPGARKISVAYIDETGANDSLPARTRTIPSGAMVRWSADGSTVTALEGKTLAIIDPALGNDKEVRVPDGTQDALLDGKIISLLTRDSSPPETADDGTLLKTLDTETGALTTIRNICTKNQTCRILASGGKRVLMRSEDIMGPRLWYVALASANAPRNEFVATAYRWEKPGDKGRLLLWNDFEVSVYDPQTDQISLITRLGTPITGAAWDPRGNDILFSTADAITAVEIDDRDVRNTFNLARLTHLDGFSIALDGSIVRFTGAIGGQGGVFEKKLE